MAGNGAVLAAGAPLVAAAAAAALGWTLSVIGDGEGNLGDDGFISVKSKWDFKEGFLKRRLLPFSTNFRERERERI